MEVKIDAKTGKLICPKCNNSGFKSNKSNNKTFLICKFCEYKADLPKAKV